MVGGGIGVTPYASTLMDLVLEKASGTHCGIKCKKVENFYNFKLKFFLQVYFLWICPTHKNFEWFIEVLKDVETLDIHGILEIHIFVTQFFHKFDLRTTVLVKKFLQYKFGMFNFQYICEKHFRGDNSGLSMFTGLKAINHFGRPNFDLFLKFLQSRHAEVCYLKKSRERVSKNYKKVCIFKIFHFYSNNWLSNVVTKISFLILVFGIQIKLNATFILQRDVFL